MKTLLVCKAAYKTTYILSGKRISKNQADSEIAAAKKVIRGGVAWYNLKGFDMLKGEKNRFFEVKNEYSSYHLRQRQKIRNNF